MKANQRYVSNELTHFVGAGLLTSEARYALLVQIVRSGLLKAPGMSDQSVEESGVAGRTTTRYSLSIHHDDSLSSNKKYLASVVCFADIPIHDLPFHMTKYSQFGLSFSKGFLVGRGANPVFYVATQSSTHVRNPLANNPINSPILLKAASEKGNRGHWENFTRAELFDEAERIQQDVLPTHPKWDPISRTHVDPLLPPDRALLRDFMSWYLFPYFKFFDPSLADEHPDNYYMEREWRILGPVPFELTDVERLLVPRKFAGRVLKDLPGYAGQLTFADEKMTG